MRELLGWVDAREEEMVELLRSLVNTDSGSYCKEGVDRVGLMLAERMRGAGIDVQVVEQAEFGNSLVARLRGAGRHRVILVGHMDTVHERGAAARRPFRIEGDRAYGPGVEDMKAGLVAGVYALLALAEFGYAGLREVKLILNGDEEVGSPTSRPLIEEEGRGCDAAFILEGGRIGSCVVTERKGVGFFVLRVTGKAAHAGVEPEKGVSAILELSRKVIALHRLNNPAQGITVNVGVLQGGSRSNVVAEHAAAEIDVRVATMPQMARMQSLLRRAALKPWLRGCSLELTGGFNRPPMVRTEATRRLLEVVRKAGRLLGTEIEETATGGGSDGNFLAALGVPVVDAMGPVGGSPHTEDEYLELASLWGRTKLLLLSLAMLPEEFEEAGEALGR